MTKKLSPREELKRLRERLDRLHARRTRTWDDFLTERYLLKRIKELERVRLEEDTPTLEH
jgi:hypothetical protein